MPIYYILTRPTLLTLRVGYGTLEIIVAQAGSNWATFSDLSHCFGSTGAKSPPKMAQLFKNGSHGSSWLTWSWAEIISSVGYLGLGPYSILLTCYSIHCCAGGDGCLSHVGRNRPMSMTMWCQPQAWWAACPCDVVRQVSPSARRRPALPTRSLLANSCWRIPGGGPDKIFQSGRPLELTHQQLLGQYAT
jgi:hypothetical protein